MPLNSKTVEKNVAAHVQSFRRLQRREPTAQEKAAIRKQHEQIATTVERK